MTKLRSYSKCQNAQEKILHDRSNPFKIYVRPINYIMYKVHTINGTGGSTPKSGAVHGRRIVGWLLNVPATG